MVPNLATEFCIMFNLDGLTQKLPAEADLGHMNVFV